MRVRLDDAFAYVLYVLRLSFQIVECNTDATINSERYVALIARHTRL